MIFFANSSNNGSVSHVCCCELRGECICESACSRSPRNAEKSLGGVVAYVWVQSDREWKGESMTEDTL